MGPGTHVGGKSLAAMSPRTFLCCTSKDIRRSLRKFSRSFVVLMIAFLTAQGLPLYVLAKRRLCEPPASCLDTGTSPESTLKGTGIFRPRLGSLHQINQFMLL